MAIRDAVRTMAIVVLVGCVPSTAMFAGQASSAACSVTIASPKNAERHGADVLVSGKATLPAGGSLWVFAHRKGVALWWPQGGGAASVKPGGDYSVLATLGGPQDLGADFEIRAQMVDRADNAKLEAWFKNAEEKGSYPGMRLPAALDGCGIPPEVTVTKTK